MAKKSPNHDWKVEHDPLDRELEAALAKYSAVEPRAGLEERVLANLHAERGRSPQSLWSRSNLVWAATAVAATLVVAAALVLRTNMRRTPVVAIHPATQAPSINQPKPRVALARENNDHTAALVPVIHHAAHRPHPAAVAQASPRLDQFPSPRPLSNEERLLVRYVQEFPEAAVTIAKAQTESEMEVERLIANQPPAETPDEQQDQQER